MFDDFREAYSWLSHNTGAGVCADCMPMLLLHAHAVAVVGPGVSHTAHSQPIWCRLSAQIPTFCLPIATDPDDKVASWWDYGYQTTAMANRTVIVDNNTWNNTHIATVGGGGAGFD